MGSTLLLVPTQLELNLVRNRLADRCEIELCGFGPIAAAARASQLIARVRPSRVLLLGIAGSYQQRLPIGTAYCFYEAVCHGVGVGAGREYHGADELGWPQYADDHLRVGDRIRLPRSGASPALADGGLLVTTCAAAANEGEAAARIALFPEAAAEDMEGFSVALACTLQAVPLTIIRGVSNRVGDRDKSQWKIDAALNAAVDIALEFLQQDPAHELHDPPGDLDLPE